MESLGIGVQMNRWAEVAHTATQEVWYNALPKNRGVVFAGEYERRREISRFCARASGFHCPAAKFPEYPELEL
jgi:hypothetical protein